MKKLPKKYKVGDTVYPCYDGKLGRGTACKVIAIDSEGRLLVEGAFWAESKIVTNAWFKLEENDFGNFNYCSWVNYDKNEATAMQLVLSAFAGEDVEGDFYVLVDLPFFKDSLKPSYLSFLGIQP